MYCRYSRTQSSRSPETRAKPSIPPGDAFRPVAEAPSPDGVGGDDNPVVTLVGNGLSEQFVVMLPQGLVPLGVPVAAEDVVDQHVEAAVITLDGGDQFGHRRRIFMVDDQGGTGAPGGLNKESIGAMRERLARVAPAFLREVREVVADGRLDETFVDALCEPAEVFTYGGMIAHVLKVLCPRRLPCRSVIATTRRW
jgi:hypothetical protein